MTEQTLMINELDTGDEAALVNPNAPSYLPADVMEGGSLQYRTVKISYKLFAEVLAQYGAVADAIEGMSSPTKLKGYYSVSDPETIEHITLKVGDLWWQGAGSDMPETFPISNMSLWDGKQWEPAPAYTANSWDLWVNINDDAGYYWFGNHWNQYDAVADGVTLENYGGKIRIKDLGVGWDKLAIEIKDMIQGAVKRSGDTMTGALHVLPATDGDTPYQKQEIDGFNFAHKHQGVPVVPARIITGAEANERIVFAKNWANLDRVEMTIKRNFHVPGNVGTNVYNIDVCDENNTLVIGLGQHEFTGEADVFIDAKQKITAAQIGGALELRVGSAGVVLGTQTPNDTALCAVYERRLLDLKDEEEARIAGDENLNAKIAAETARAANAENNLNTAILTEKSRAQAAEGELSSGVSDAQARADAAFAIAEAALPRAHVVDNLEDGGSEKALSAEQGKVLKRLIGGSLVGNFMYSMGRSIPKEWAPLKGIRISVAHCPTLHEKIKAGELPVLSESEWIARYNASNGTCGCFGYVGASHHTASEIILPHMMNGAYLVSRQDKGAGDYIQDSIVDIQGRVILGRGLEGMESISGVFGAYNGAADNSQGHNAYNTVHKGFEFKASRVVHTDDRVQPRSVNIENVLMFIGDDFDFAESAIIPVRAEDCDLDLQFGAVYQITTTVPIMIKNVSSENKLFTLNGAPTGIAPGATLPLAQNDRLRTIQTGLRLVISTAVAATAFDYKLAYEATEPVIANKWYKYDDGPTPTRNIRFFPIDSGTAIDDVEILVEDASPETAGAGAYHIEKAVDFFFTDQIAQSNLKDNGFTLEKAGVNKRFLFLTGAGVSNVKIFYDFIALDYDANVLLPRVPYRWKEELRAIPQENFFTLNNSGGQITIAYRPRNNANGRFGTGVTTYAQGAAGNWTSTAAAASNAIICKGYTDDKAKEGAYPNLSAYVICDNRAIGLNATSTNLTKDAIYKINYGMDGVINRTTTHYYLGQITNSRTEPVTLRWVDDPAGEMLIAPGATSPLIKQGQSFYCAWDGVGSGNVTWNVNPNTDGSDIDMLMFGQYINSTGQIRTLINKSDKDYKYYIGTSLKTINPRCAYAVNNSEVVRPNDALRLESWMGQGSHEPDKIPKTDLIYNEFPDVIDLDTIPDKRIAKIRPLRPIKVNGAVRKYLVNPRSVALGLYYDGKLNWGTNGGVDTVPYLESAHTGIFFNKESGTTIAAGDYTDNLFAGITPHGLGGEDIYVYRDANQPTVAPTLLSGSAQTLTNNAPYVARSTQRNLVLSCPNAGMITLGRYDDKYVSMREYDVPTDFAKIPLAPGDFIHTFNSNGVQIEVGMSILSAVNLVAGVLYYNPEGNIPKFVYKIDPATEYANSPLLYKGGRLSEGAHEIGKAGILFGYDWVQAKADDETTWTTPVDTNAPISNDNTARRITVDGLKLINSYIAQTIYMCYNGSSDIVEIPMEIGDEIELGNGDCFFVYDNVDIEEV